MTTIYPVETVYNPRAFVYASNTEVLSLQSITNESRLRFLNNTIDNTGITPGYILNASNADFRIQRDSTVITTFNVTSGGIPQLRVPGHISSDRIQLTSTNDKRSIVLADYNSSSAHQIAGLGFVNAQLQYQLPAAEHSHRFLAAADAFSSYELMRIQRSAVSGLAQVGVGLGARTMASNVAFHVIGDMRVEGAIILDQDKYVSLDSNTGRIPQSQLPNKVVYVDNNNKVDASILPQEFNFQFLKAQKNVGIGTKSPIQKFHVQGSTYISQRLGIGVTTPIARIHATESAAAIPTVYIENNASGSILTGVYNGSTIIDIKNGVGIGTTNPNGNMLRVVGNTNLSSVVCQTLSTSNISVNNYFQTSTALNAQAIPENQFQVFPPTIFNSRIQVSTIRSSNLNVRFENCGILADGEIRSQSDERIKHDIQKITDPLRLLQQINGYTYATKYSTTRSAGVLAQEVLQALPEAVYTNPDDGMYSVSYNGIIAMLVECVKALSDEVNALKAAT